MVSSGLLRRVALVRTDVSEEPGASETTALTRATRRNSPEDTILHSNRRENLKSYRVIKSVGVALNGKAQNREMWRALVNVVMNVHIPQKCRNSFSN
jgi:hypothetical protein